jgi:hypothetical protein
MQRHTSHRLVIGLILLLGVQLTGLSCLEEWRIASLAGSVGDTPQITDVTMESGAPLAEDGYPCHMVFVSIPSGVFQPSHPVSIIARGAPIISPVVSPFLHFHPPLSL